MDARKAIHLGVQALIQETPVFTHRDTEIITHFETFIAEYDNCLERTCTPGHLTASAFVFSENFEHLILLKHKKLGRWLQPGGHVDGSPDLFASACRELVEETSLSGFEAISQHPLDLDIHEIPARGKEPAHFHYDVRFGFFAARNELSANAESDGVRWCRVDELSRYTEEESIHRAVAKAKELAQATTPSAPMTV